MGVKNVKGEQPSLKDNLFNIKDLLMQLHLSRDLEHTFISFDV